MTRLLLCVSLLISSASFAQNGFFRADATIGGAFTTGNLKSYGISAGVEPKYFFNENISVGLRLSGEALFGGSIDGASSEVSLGISSRAANGIKGEYYLGSGNTKPFAGLMIGYYTQANIGTAVQGGGANVTASAVRTIGFGPELGVTFGNFRISGIYHLVPGKDLVSINTAVGGVEQVEISRNYFVIQLGFRIFGTD
ncbi:MAG: hypothetical protein AB8B56_18535 [Crocinitomicaceae bacterium]